MFVKYGVKAYQEVEAATTSPWKLVDMLYEGAIRFIDQGNHFRAKLVVDEGLFASLNPRIALSATFADLYDAVSILLESPRGYSKARHILVSMRETWLNLKPSP